ncbi:MAG: divalent metal cation transporter [Mobilicoccus sp.]|nr:divalent metal cation transporter [Mobilicoccus sp.]
MSTATPPPEGHTTAAEDKAAARARRTAIVGAMFLMATSAIGPGFITQTTTFTAQLGAAFAFAIVVSILVDIAVQMNVWRVVGVSGLRAHELANSVLPGLGWFLTILVLLGGFVFNIGNVAGSGLGLDALMGLDPLWGGLISAGIAIAIFLSKAAGAALDRIVIVLGVLMILLTSYVAITSNPPVGEALRNVVMPTDLSGQMMIAITTLIGGTVGGYITYAGAHRLLDSGTTGPENAQRISRSSMTGILITGVMRFVLFFAILGVTAGGFALGTDNPAADAFQHAAGEVGLRLFGVILWAAAITSVIGASYTSVSFLTTKNTTPRIRNLLTVGFIAICTGLYVWLGQAPVTLLIFAGAFNGIILPIGFTVILIAIFARRDLFGGAYQHPRWLTVSGILAWGITLYLGAMSLMRLGELFT